MAIESDTILTDGSELIIGSGDTFNNITVGRWGRLHVASGGTATGIVEDGGIVTVVDGADVTFTPNSFSGKIYNQAAYGGDGVLGTVHSGTTAHNTTVRQGGGLLVYYGGVAYDTTLFDEDARAGVVTFIGAGDLFTGGNLTVYSGGTANGVNAVNGCLIVSSGGTATGIVENGGYVEIQEGADVAFASNTFFGEVLASASATVHSGTTAYNTTVSMGLLSIHSGGIAYNTHEKGGHLSIYSGGTACCVVNDGLLTVSSGGKLTGRVFSSERRNNTVYVSSGGIIDFDLTQTSPGADARIKCGIGGSPAYTVTVNEDQTEGVYALAEYAEGFDQTISVRNSAGTNLGTLSVGETVLIKDTAYVLSVLPDSGGLLSLKIGETNTPSPYTSDGLIANSVYGGTVRSGDIFHDTCIFSRGCLYVSSGGTATDTTIYEFGNLTLCGVANYTTVNANGIFNLSSGAVANYTTVNRGAAFGPSSGAMINSTTINNGGNCIILSGGGASGLIINSGGHVTVNSGGKITGQIFVAEENGLTIRSGAVIEFDISELTPEAGARIDHFSFLDVARNAPVYTLTVSEMQRNGTYVLAEGVTEFISPITVKSTTSTNLLGTLRTGNTIRRSDYSYTLNLTDSVLSVKVEGPNPPPDNLVGAADKVSWDATGAEQHVVEYSMDNFEHVIRIVTSAAATDLVDLPAGTYQWRVKASGKSYWAVGEEIVSEPEPEAAAPKVVQSNEDGNDDLFFASTNGTWSNRYYAQHVGSLNDWTGTNEIVAADGKGRIRNLFFGSADPNVLCLTDGENGDAIFVDDVFTDLPEEVAEHTARLYRIQEIRAGAGDDIVDMTS